MDSTSSSDFYNSPPSSAEPVLNDEAQEVMNDNLELMREVVMKIREDEEYARNIYTNCPRLQALLKDHPDLRPLFEDPKFVVLNFEKVYRDAGGTLPGDEDANKPGIVQKIKAIIGKITSHPLFKVFKILMLIKKIVFFFSPTKFTGILKSFMWPSLDDMELDEDGLDPEDPDYEAQKTKLALNNAADALEDPEVQEQMQEAMDDPDKMEDMIENNKELRELRDSNPLCAEMMNDPETLKIISDPENLRALSEAPDLIAEDFANPDAFLDAIENAEMEGGDVDADFDADVDAEVEAEAEMDDDAEYSEEEYSEEEEEEEEEDDDDDDDEDDDEDGDEDGDGILDDVEYELDEDDDNRERSRSRRSKQRSVNQQRQKDAEKDGEEDGGGGKFGFLGTRMEAGVGLMTGDMEGIGDIFGGGEDMAFEGGEFEGGEEFEGGDESMLEGIEEEEEPEENELLATAEENLEDVEATEKEDPDDNELLAQAEENLEDVEATEKEQPEENELLDKAEENLEDVEETEREEDESSHASEIQGVFATAEELDEGAVGQGADFADEFDADENKDKDKEKGGGGGTRTRRWNRGILWRVRR